MYDYSSSLILGWANGYYKDKYKITTAIAVEQKLRKEALNSLDSMTLRNKDGNTAICFAAATGIVEIAMVMVEKNNNLPMI